MTSTNSERRIHNLQKGKTCPNPMPNGLAHAHLSSNATTLSNIKDMLAGLPQFQQGKELYSLHLSMAQECMNIFQACKLPDVASVEQVGLSSLRVAFFH